MREIENADSVQCFAHGSSTDGDDCQPAGWTLFVGPIDTKCHRGSIHSSRLDDFRGARTLARAYCQPLFLPGIPYMTAFKAVKQPPLRLTQIELVRYRWLAYNISVALRGQWNIELLHRAIQCFRQFGAA